MRIKGWIALGFSRGWDKCLKLWALDQYVSAKANCVFYIVHRLKPAAIEKVLLLIRIIYSFLRIFSASSSDILFFW
jgi:hypothetical protein